MGIIFFLRKTALNKSFNDQQSLFLLFFKYLKIQQNDL